MKKNKIYIYSLILFPSLLISPTIISSCSSNNHSKITLTKSEVLNNFNKNGKWYGRTSLAHEDFNNYSSIDFDAFDGLENELKLIELPSSIKINIDETKSILWKKVNKINIFKEDEENVKIINNILFSWNGNGNFINHYVARTISNRIENISIIFPNDDNINNFVYSISDNFYNEIIFKNVSNISFLPNLPIINIGKSAFENCKLLDKELNLSFKLIKHIRALFDFYFLTLKEKAFNNTNIVKLNISFNRDYKKSTLPFSLIIVQKECFANNKLLNSLNSYFQNNDNPQFEGFQINDALFFDERAFYNSPLNNINIIAENLMMFSEVFAFDKNSIDREVQINTNYFNFMNNVFSGNYNKFKLSLIKSIFITDLIDNGDNFLSGIECDINNFEILLIGYIDKLIVDKFGLTNEQKNKIIYY